MPAVRSLFLAAILGCAVPAAPAFALTTTTTPYTGVTYITRLGETVGTRTVNMHILDINLNAPGIGFKLTPEGGGLDTVRQSTLGFMQQEQAQFAVNAAFFLPFPSSQSDADLVGFFASQGSVISGFETPVQSYAIVTNAPAINISADNSASVVHADASDASGLSVLENVSLGTAFSGSAQIVTNGAVTVPEYNDATHPDGLLTIQQPGQTGSQYSNSDSWYNRYNARTIIGLTQDNSHLVIFTVDNAGGSNGLSVGQAANILVNDYQVYNALNMDGGGSTTMAMLDPLTGIAGIVNKPSDTTPGGRLVGANLAVFAVPEPETYALFLVGLGLVTLLTRRRASISG